MRIKVIKTVIIVLVCILLLLMAMMWEASVVPDIVALLISALGLISVVWFYKESPSAGVYVLATVGFAIAFSRVGVNEGRGLAIALAVIFGTLVAFQPAIAPWLDGGIRRIDARYADWKKRSTNG